MEVFAAAAQRAESRIPNPASRPAPAAVAQPREDLYLPIHKALRSLMAGVLVKAGRMDWQDEADTTATLGEVRAMLDILRGHLEHENRFVHPALEARQPGSSARRAAEHVEHVESIERLRSMVAAVESRSPAERAQPSLALYRALALFVAENLVHMNEEEIVHNGVLWAHYSDEELIEIHDALVASIPQQEMGAVLSLMIPALAPAERVGLLGGMRMGMPPEAFAGVVALARGCLAERDWAKLSSALGLDGAAR